MSPPCFHSSAFRLGKALVLFTGISANKREGEKSDIKFENPETSITGKLQLQLFPLLETIS